jgi:hypothetical protein
MSILLGCDSFLALRNVRNGDLGRHLRGHDPIALVDPNQYDGSLAVAPAGVRVDRLLDTLWMKDPALKPFIHRAYYARKAVADPRTIWQDMKQEAQGTHKNRPVRRALATVRQAGVLGRFWLHGKLGRDKPWRADAVRALQAHAAADRYARYFAENDARVVAALSPEGPREMLLMEAARREGLPTAVMIRSRDNLAAKIHHLPEADLYFVWSQVTKDYFHYLYPEIAPERVRVTGSPQFDRHLDPRFRLTREEFFRQVGLDPNRPLVVFTLLTPGLAPQELKVAQHLADAAHKGLLAGGAQLLVRGHPRMFGANMPLLETEYSEARYFPRPTPHPYRSAEHEARVVQCILDDEPMHLATIAYQNVQVNSNGTMTIDSAILDKPTVHIYYDLVPGVPSGLSIKRLYERSDSRQMQAYGCSRLARSPEECVKLINQYLEHPELDAEGRRRAREQDCGPLNGRAGERIAAGLLELAKRS